MMHTHTHDGLTHPRWIHTHPHTHTTETHIRGRGCGGSGAEPREEGGPPQQQRAPNEHSRAKRAAGTRERSERKEGLTDKLLLIVDCRFFHARTHAGTRAPEENSLGLVVLMGLRAIFGLEIRWRYYCTAFCR